MKKRKIILNFLSLIFYIAVITLCIKLFNSYKTIYFNDFIKGENKQDITEFVRDNKIKYSKYRSYKIQSNDFNDAAFYKEIEVKPNTSYKVSCMVKTENIKAEKENSDAGAMISLIEQSEVSRNIRGTSNWQELTLVFNSKKRDKVKIGFRLGGNKSNAKGTAWFSNLKLEEGKELQQDTNWKMGCFIFKNIDVNIKNKRYKFALNNQEIANIKENTTRFTYALEDLSYGRMTAKCSIHEIEEPITTISFDEKFGYYIDPCDVKDKIEEIVLNNEYDYIFIAVKMGDEVKEIPVEDWIGLGSMRLYDVGYSIIRLSNTNRNLIYQYKRGINEFPEEVYVHEFLHTLERNLQEYNYKFPELHDNKKFGYEESFLYNLKYWYRDYMRCEISNKNSGKYVGLDSIVYSLKPVHNSNFEATKNIQIDNEPRNIKEEFNTIFKIIKEVTLPYINDYKKIGTET